MKVVEGIFITPGSGRMMSPFAVC